MLLAFYTGYYTAWRSIYAVFLNKALQSLKDRRNVVNWFEFNTFFCKKRLHRRRRDDFLFCRFKERGSDGKGAQEAAIALKGIEKIFCVEDGFFMYGGVDKGKTDGIFIDKRRQKSFNFRLCGFARSTEIVRIKTDICGSGTERSNKVF